MIVRKNVAKIYGQAIPKRKAGHPLQFAPMTMPKKKLAIGKKKRRVVPPAPKSEPRGKNKDPSKVERSLTNEIAISERRATVFELVKRSYAPREIAKKLGLSINLIYDDINTELYALRRSTVVNAEATRDLELERLDMIQKDLLPFCLNHLAPVRDGKKGETEMVGPDHKKIETLLKIMERRAKYLGLDMPDTHIQLSIPWEKLSIDQAARIAAGVDLKIIMAELENAPRALPESTGHIIDAEVIDDDA